MFPRDSALTFMSEYKEMANKSLSKTIKQT